MTPNPGHYVWTNRLMDTLRDNAKGIVIGVVAATVAFWLFAPTKERVVMQQGPTVYVPQPVPPPPATITSPATTEPVSSIPQTTRQSTPERPLKRILHVNIACPNHIATPSGICINEPQGWAVPSTIVHPDSRCRVGFSTTEYVDRKLTTICTNSNGEPTP